ncbi:DNA-binding NarL/FixJ family response regulator [Sporosarcina luteola]|nr:DNA-binding NarL/FixJ family response regulator [Sporosarcina luteola]
MNVILVDDHPLVRKGLAAILSLDRAIQVVGEATTGSEALRLMEQQNADVAIVDLRLGEESGLDLVETAMSRKVSCKFLILTSSTDEEDFLRAKRMGVAGYVLKEALPEELLHALLLISKGRTYFDQGVLDFVMNTRKSPDSITDQLTPKEMEILKELGKGLSNREIAKKLFITEYTVKKHVSQVLAKLELTDRTHAALYANAKGLVRYVVN